MSQVLAHKQTQQILEELLVAPLRYHLYRKGWQFLVSWNLITCHSIKDEISSNHTEADTLLTHCITSSKSDDKGFCVSASNVDVAVLLIAYHKLLSFKNVYFGTSTENTNIDSHLQFLGSEPAKCLWNSIVSLVTIQLKNFIMPQTIDKHPK